MSSTFGGAAGCARTSSAHKDATIAALRNLDITLKDDEHERDVDDRDKRREQRSEQNRSQSDETGDPEEQQDPQTLYAELARQPTDAQQHQETPERDQAANRRSAVYHRLTTFVPVRIRPSGSR